MRRLSLLLCALVVALGFSVPRLLNAKPVYAAADCIAGESDDVVYEDVNWGRTAIAFVSEGSGGHYVDVALRTWHISHLGRCWRTYEGVVKVEDGTSASIATQWRGWVCGSGPTYFQDGRGAQWTWIAAITPQGGWGPGDWMWWTIPNATGGATNAVWASYGSRSLGAGWPCNPNSDSYQSIAQNAAWNPSVLVSNVGSAWYVSM